MLLGRIALARVREDFAVSSFEPPTPFTFVVFVDMKLHGGSSANGLLFDLSSKNYFLIQASCSTEEASRRDAMFIETNSAILPKAPLGA
jgi:hypothetical protein